MIHALNVEWVGFTLKWYHVLFNDSTMLQAASNSIIIGVTSSFLATILGTMAGYALYRYQLKVLPFLRL